MKSWMKCLTVTLLICGAAAAIAAQERSSTSDDLVDRIAAREKQEIATIRQYNPIVETYIQETKPNSELGSIPVKDHYFLGVADFHQGVVDHSLIEIPIKWWSYGHFDPGGFLYMIFIETRGFDRRHFHFEYVRREFLGEVRCLVFDVEPLPNSRGPLFKGRIWANEKDYTIVRFNGVHEPIKTRSGFYTHMDSWRANMGPGLWLPSYVYSEETNLKEDIYGTLRFKAQTRLWGYNAQNIERESEFSELRIDAPGSVQDQTAAAPDPLPIEAYRQWQHTAEENVLDRLQRSGLLAAPGPVDRVLGTVVNNIEVTNNLDIQPEVRCRVLLTSTLESFSIGHTIVISRGLLDVLPDEASLAAMLAQELAPLTFAEPHLDMWGFNDLTNISTIEVIDRLNFQKTKRDVQMANQKALELLLKSPYKDKLVNAGLFLKQLSVEEKILPSLLQPRLGNQVFLADKLMATAPPLQPRNVNQSSALPLGGRIKLDPWNDRIAMLQSSSRLPASPGEKKPFEVTPFEPFLTYFKPSPLAAIPQSQISADTVVEPSNSLRVNHPVAMQPTTKN